MAMNKAPRSSSPLAVQAPLKGQPPITQRSRRAQEAHRKEGANSPRMNTVGRNAGEHDFSER
jgi:hypothetical protein